MSRPRRLGNFRLGVELFGKAPGKHIVLPFRRSPVLMIILLLFAAAFTYPAYEVATKIDLGLGREASLHELTFGLFHVAWLLGWSAGLMLIYAILLMLVLGRETLVLRPGDVEIRFGLPGIFLATHHDPAGFAVLERVIPAASSGHNWRGPHLRLMHGEIQRELGSHLSEARASEIIAMIRSLPAVSSTRLPVADIGQRRPLSAVDKTVPERRVGLTSPSTLMLILVNLLPIAGVLWLGWDLGTVMILFWAESGIIGFFNVLKMIVVGRWLALFAGIFFTGHFGGFMAVHLLFVYSIFVTGMEGQQGESLAAVTRYFTDLWPVLLALFLSHGLSFLANFIGRREYAGKSLREQMTEPYQRIMVMHVTILLGGGISLALGEPTLALLVLVGLKIAVDIRAHLRQRVLPPASH